MIQRISKELQRRSNSQGGFTLIELLVVIVILAILAAVVVFAVQGTGDKGQAAAVKTDVRTVRTAQETFCAQNGRYGTESELVAAGLLSEESSLSDVAPVPGGACTGAGDEMKSSFITGYQQPNGGSPQVWERLRLAASPNMGRPTPFAFTRPPGYLLASLMFDPLVWRDATGQPLPWLATSWTQPDPTTWKFTLRDGVRWSDGTPFTAEDVAFTFNYVKPGQPGNATLCFCKISFPYLSSVTTDPANPSLGVIFTLTTPINTFMQDIAQGMVIVPKHIWNGVADPVSKVDASAFVGTGPYTLVNPAAYPVATGVSEYNANTSFFLGTPYVRKLQFISSADALTGVRSGALDAGAPGQDESVSDAALAAVSGIPKVVAAGGWNRVLHFNMTKGFPYNDVRFRQAIAYAIDRKDLVQRILSGRGQPGSMGALAPSHPYLAPGLPTYDRNLATAGQLLDSINIKDTNGDGKRELPSTPGTNFKPTIYTSNQFQAGTLTALQEYLNAVGIESTIAPEAGPASDARSTNGDYEIIVVGWGNVQFDPDLLRARLLHTWTSQPSNRSWRTIYGWSSSASSPGTNAAYATNADEFEALANSQQVDPDRASRKQKVHRMQQLIAEDVPQISLYVPDLHIFYPQGGFSAWYSTPGGTPASPPSFNNKHVFVTGKQFGLPPAT